MGISTNVYTYWGIKTPWNQEVADCSEELYEANSGHLEILEDAMACDYMVFGIRKFDSGDFRYGEEDGSSEIEVKPYALRKEKDEWMDQFKLFYPNQYEWLLKQGEWKIITIVHFS